jgi:hypothetical protein
VPLEAVAEQLLFVDQIFGPVLPDEVDTGLRESRDLLRPVVFARDEHPDSVRLPTTPLKCLRLCSRARALAYPG